MGIIRQQFVKEDKIIDENKGALRINEAVVLLRHTTGEHERQEAPSLHPQSGVSPGHAKWVGEKEIVWAGGRREGRRGKRRHARKD